MACWIIQCASCGLEQRDDPQAGGVREVGLVGLAVVLDRADAAAERDADDDRHARRSPSERARSLATWLTMWSNAG